MDDVHDHEQERRPPISPADTTGREARDLSAEELLDRIPPEQLDALLAGAAERQHRPVRTDALEQLRARLDELQAAVQDATLASSSRHEKAQLWDDNDELGDELDDEDPAEVHDIGDHV